MENKRGIINRLTLWLTVVGIIGIFFVLIFYSKMRFGIGVRCPFYYELAYECPGCGGTRMLVSLMKMDFYQAFRFNAFLTLTLPSVIIIYLYQSYTYIRYNKILSWLYKYVLAYVIAWAIFTVLRNSDAFAWLAPTLIA